MGDDDKVKAAYDEVIALLDTKQLDGAKQALGKLPEGSKSQERARRQIAVVEHAVPTKRKVAWGIGWILFAFGFALALQVWGRIDRSNEVYDHVQVIKVDLLHRLGVDGDASWRDLKLEEIQAKVREHVAAQYPHVEGSAPSANEQRYRDFASAIGREIFTNHKKENASKRFDERARTGLQFNTLNLSILTGFALVVFAGLMIAGLMGAYARAVRLAEQPNLLASSFRNAVMLERAKRYIANNAKALFPRRVAFALILVFGVTYGLSPLGLQGAAITEYVTQFPIPGQPSYPGWFAQFREAPPFLYGFAGYQLYALTITLQRYIANDLNERLTVMLINRALVVIVISLVASAITTGDDVSRSLLFIVGIFPQTAVDLLAKKASVVVGRLEETTFQGLPELGLAKQTTLREHGIDTTHDLARCDLEDLMLHVGIDPGVLVRACDRALLIDLFGLEKLPKLEEVAVFTASDLVLLCCYPKGTLASLRETAGPQAFGTSTVIDEDQLKLVATKLGVETVRVQVEALASDANVRYILKALTYRER
jgi:hypothetical protein